MKTDAIDFFRSHNDITLIAHVSPDGDTLGSCLGLYHALSSVGKTIQVVCDDPVPKIYCILPGAEKITNAAMARLCQAVASIDCADVARTGECAALLNDAQDTLNMDHHGTNTAYAKYNYVRTCAATAELAFEIIHALGIPFSVETATCLYTGLTTDTGNFSYSNTTPDTFKIAAELLSAGIDLPKLNRALFRTTPFRKMRLMALAIERAQFARGNSVVISALTKADYASCNATSEDTEGVIDSLRDIDTVEIAAFLHESDSGAVRVSLRGKSRANVSTIATQFGGGGHRFAAGCSLNMPITEACKQIMDAATALYDGMEN